MWAKSELAQGLQACQHMQVEAIMLQHSPLQPQAGE
jgi:hypothetical protein